MTEIVSFGEWVQKRRNHLNLTRAGLARLMNCAPITVKKIERDERRPSIQIAQLLATNLQIPQSDQADFIRRARGEFIAHFSSPADMSLDEAQTADVAPPKHNLPNQVTPFVGRVDEITQIRTTLNDPTCRLLTILGAGGMGKTRLSIAVAQTAVSDYTDGVLFVPLAPIQMKAASDAINPLIGAIADALKMTFYGDKAPETQLINYLRRKEMLLVLDNFEHLLETADFISQLLPHAPDVKVLTTSRERLNLSEEWLFTLQGLAFPGPSAEKPEQSFSAIDLFSQRAKQVNRNFDPAAESHAIREICQLVDGMPLGIELAASWVSQLSCREVVTEIKRELDFLSSDLRNIPERHRNIRAVFANSWQQLSTDEQHILQKLSVFRGGFQREAAETITGASLKHLSTLVNKSMIRRNANGRYEIHELMRQFAAEKLRQNPEAKRETEDKHGRYFLNYWAEQEAKLYGSNGLGVVSEIRSNIDNLRLAWQWGVDNVQVSLLNDSYYLLVTFYDAQDWYLEAEEMFSQAKISLETAVLHDAFDAQIASAQEIEIMCLNLYAAVGYFLARQGQIDRGIIIMEEAIDQLAESGDELQRLVFIALAVIVFYKGEFSRTQALAQAYAEHFEQTDKKHIESLGHYVAGLGAVAAGEYQIATELANRSYDLATEMGSQMMPFYSYRLLGRIAIATGHYSQAIKYLQESFEISWAHGFPAQSMWHLIELGDAARLDHRFEDANGYYERSLAIAIEMNSPSAMATTYWGVGNLALQRGDYEAAQAAFAKSHQTMKIQSWSSGGPGWVAVAIGKVAEAKQIFMSELSTVSQLKQAPRALDILVGLAHVHAHLGDLTKALEWAVFIEQHPASAFETKERAGNLKRDLIAELPSESVKAAVSHRPQLDLWQTVSTLLTEQASAPKSQY